MELDYNTIKRKVEKERCAEHKQNAEFTKTSNGFSIKACCENFEKRMAEKAEIIIVEETENSIDRIMLNIFSL